MREDNLFEMHPKTIFFGLMTMRQIKFQGEYAGIKAYQQLNNGRYNILLDNGKTIQDVNFKTDLDYDLPSLLMGRSNLVYLKDENGNYTNQDPDSRNLRDACAQIEDLTTQNKQLKMDVSRLIDEKKEFNNIENVSSQLGSAVNNTRGYDERQSRHEIMRKIQQPSDEQHYPDEVVDEQQDEQQQREEE